MHPSPTLLWPPLAVPAALFAAGLALSACSGSSNPVSKPTVPACGPDAPELTASASGQATGTPDLLTLTVGVQTSGTTATAALSSDDSEATGVIKALKAGGVAPKDIQTTNLSIFPTYDNHGNINGYSVNNTVIAKVHDQSGTFAGAGSLIDAVAGQAGNDIRLNGIGFSVQDASVLEGQARAQAVHAAFVHAQDMAAASGERLAGLCSLTDTPGVSTVAPRSSGQAFNSAASLDASTPLQPGVQQVTAQVSAVYSLTTSKTSFSPNRAAGK